MRRILESQQYIYQLQNQREELSMLLCGMTYTLAKFLLFYWIILRCIQKFLDSLETRSQSVSFLTLLLMLPNVQPKNCLMCFQQSCFMHLLSIYLSILMHWTYQFSFILLNLVDLKFFELTSLIWNPKFESYCQQSQ